MIKCAFMLIFLLVGGVLAADIEADLNTPFTLKKGITAKVRKTDFEIKITKCGRENSGRNKAEIPYCDAEVFEKGARKTVKLKDRVILNDYTIVVVNIDLTTNPRAQDPSSENSCTIIVRRKRIVKI